MYVCVSQKVSQVFFETTNKPKILISFELCKMLELYSLSLITIIKSMKLLWKMKIFQKIKLGINNVYYKKSQLLKGIFKKSHFCKFVHLINQNLS